ncbi:class I SAM-dependent methyltransferase [Patescibacteria group bacterium]|nr:class I SAM-dependent methyltransferase [Patescibacteria group bacterium]
MKFDWYNKYYDKYIDKICPDYELMLNKLTISIHVKDIKNSKIKELGCGTGKLTMRLAKNFSKIKIYAFDNDKNQLAKAQLKFKKYNYNNVIFKRQDIRDIKFGKEDVVISSLLFHLLLPDNRKNIFKKLSDSNIKSIYIFDRVKGESLQKEKKYKIYFKKNLKNNKLPTKLANDLIKETNLNKPDKLSEQKKFFESKGYQLKIIFQNPNHGFKVYSYSKIR